MLRTVDKSIKLPYKEVISAGMNSNVNVRDKLVQEMVNQEENSSKKLLNETKVKIPFVPSDNYDKAQESTLSIQCLCFSLDKFSPATKFSLITAGIFIFYLVYGYLQELIFQLDGMKPFGWYLTLFQFKLYSAFGVIESRLKGDTTRRISLKVYSLLALLTVATMGLSNSAVAYLNYPTQVMFKSCKLIPVLFGSFLIQGKPIGVVDLVAALFMSLGLVFFTLADVQVSPTYDTTGILMISLALVADAAIGNVQEKNMKSSKASNTEVILYSYSIGFVYIFVFMVATSQLHEAFHFCLQHPIETYGYFTLFSITGYFGLQLVLALIKSNGVFTAVTVTTCRKAVTIVFSFVFFAKPFTIQYLWSGLLVVLGIYINVYSKKLKIWNINWHLIRICMGTVCRRKLNEYQTMQV